MEGRVETWIELKMFSFNTKINYLLFHKFVQLKNNAFYHLAIILTLVTTTVHAMKL